MELPHSCAVALPPLIDTHYTCTTAASFSPPFHYSFICWFYGICLWSLVFKFDDLGSPVCCWIELVWFEILRKETGSSCRLVAIGKWRKIGGRKKNEGWKIEKMKKNWARIRGLVLEFKVLGNFWEFERKENGSKGQRKEVARGEPRVARKGEDRNKESWTKMRGCFGAFLGMIAMDLIYFH